MFVSGATDVAVKTRIVTRKVTTDPGVVELWGNELGRIELKGNYAVVKPQCSLGNA